MGEVVIEPLDQAEPSLLDRTASILDFRKQFAEKSRFTTGKELVASSGNIDELPEDLGD